MTDIKHTANAQNPLRRLLTDIQEMLGNAEYSDGIARCLTHDVEQVEASAEAVQRNFYGSADDVLAALRGCVFVLDKTIGGPGPSPRAALESAHAAIARLTGAGRGGAPKAITVQVHGGLITDVSGLPEGFELHVEDYDLIEPEDPRWNAEKECSISVYEGGTA